MIENWQAKIKELYTEWLEVTSFLLPSNASVSEKITFLEKIKTEIKTLYDAYLQNDIKGLDKHTSYYFSLFCLDLDMVITFQKDLVKNTQLAVSLHDMKALIKNIFSYGDKLT